MKASLERPTPAYVPERAGSFRCMGRRYDQSELNIYGAEDDDDMDAIYRAMDTWEQRESAPETDTNSS